MAHAECAASSSLHNVAFQPRVVFTRGKPAAMIQTRAPWARQEDRKMLYKVCPIQRTQETQKCSKLDSLLPADLLVLFLSFVVLVYTVEQPSSGQAAVVRKFGKTSVQSKRPSTPFRPGRA